MTVLLLFVLGITTPVYPGESIQDALDSSIPGDTVLVMPGTHYGNGDNLLVITGDHNGIVLLGDSLEPSSVILSGDSLSDSIIDMDCTITGPIDSTMVISGFLFTDGNASLDAFGGAIHTKNSSPLIQYSEFIQCTADNGGAIFSWKGTPDIRYCDFQSNECSSAGAAVYLYTSDASVNHCRFQDNVSWDDGAAIFCYHCSPKIFNCLFTGGYAHDDGGSIYCFALSHPEISFCTFFDNSVLYTGSAVYFRVGSSPMLHHNIVTGNSGPAFYIQDGGEPVFLNNCVWGNPDGNYGNLPDPTGTGGNISVDPLLVDDFFLSQTAAGQVEDSPCVNSGDGSPADYDLAFTWTRTDSVPDSEVVDIGYHHGSQQSGLVLNELMAKNDTTISDNYGEFDDWIEITNTGPADMNLSGYYLTDDTSDPFKFAFPDTVIHPGDYFIVWADEDPNQGSMHAEFKLASAGEEVYLFYSFLIVDHITFPALEADVSYGRWPDSFGEWEFLSVATPGAPNDSGTGSETPDTLDLRILAPNPFCSSEVLTIQGGPGYARLDVYDLSGRLVATPLEGDIFSSESFSWDAASLSTGVYFLRLIQGEETVIRKITVMK